MVVLEKEYDRQIVGDSQLDMTRFQKQVLLKEEERQQEQAQQDHGVGSKNPSGTLNAKHPKVGNSGFSETVRYKNEQEFSTENQVEFVD